MATWPGWRKAASELWSRLKADRKNHETLGDPWGRAAHSMAQGWRIRMSLALKSAKKARARPTSWEAFAKHAVQAACTRRLQVTGARWVVWARSKTALGCRYVPKRDRPKT